MANLPIVAVLDVTAGLYTDVFLTSETRLTVVIALALICAPSMQTDGAIFQSNAILCRQTNRQRGAVWQNDKAANWEQNTEVFHFLTPFFMRRVFAMAHRASHYAVRYLIYNIY